MDSLAGRYLHTGYKIYRMGGRHGERFLVRCQQHSESRTHESLIIISGLTLQQISQMLVQNPFKVWHYWFQKQRSGPHFLKTCLLGWIKSQIELFSSAPKNCGELTFCIFSRIETLTSAMKQIYVNWELFMSKRFNSLIYVGEYQFLMLVSAEDRNIKSERFLAAPSPDSLRAARKKKIACGWNFLAPTNLEGEMAAVKPGSGQNSSLGNIIKFNQNVFKTFKNFFEIIFRDSKRISICPFHFSSPNCAMLSISLLISLFI